ncbi:molybdopterin-synthase adenylyltransferase MoeB [Roseospira marina]|uniref:Molybdopterin-synthase adenylyltransferase n=1 Tax=Roseospira marina TaxID=140057 RepID=A0A5M6IA69_9PROT|nr:molybdopterin-synthase adenylyltransferase MoeB [Roseospira marina]KAA5605093.1 molybdopterin-synthase adenylyltransferase MoeB [Roseospira marina]MBB4314841.1 adenylyltransferase/sulfurtransferase [Roseospira marina]MBB5087841.1 adenylyltransferase/sulfurtransferase [Roseospira marina]
MEFSEEQIRRYARHIVLREVGGEGQARLLGARVLVVGAGGLGSPLILYLAAAGVGAIGVVDPDTVDVSNLQRQVLHGGDTVGQPKVESARRAVARLNPDVRLVPHPTRLTIDTVEDLLAGYDLVCDGSDNFPTRFLLNDACHFARKTLVSAAVLRFDGQLSVYKTHAGGPCYRCIFPAPPPPDMVPSCGEAGILGAVSGVMGTLQATETLKEILGIGRSMAGRLLIHDALEGGFRTVTVKPDPTCPLCGTAPTITDLSIHRAGTGAAAPPS